MKRTLDARLLTFSDLTTRVPAPDAWAQHVALRAASAKRNELWVEKER